MHAAIQFLCALFTAVAMSLALAHALELPGKLRKRFFGTDASGSKSADWTQLRNRWELGHLARTVTATAAFVLTTFALVAA